ncbi:3837_t:CDS:2 [Gigaspora rosea]|nr:3837_t:CDS:2 [Gigaspora rosea]
MSRQLYNKIIEISINEYMENELNGIDFKCSQCRNLAKKPKKHENIENQRDRPSIQRFDCKGTIKLVSKEIKLEIQKNLHLSPSEIYKQLEQEHLDLTQKQVHAWWTSFIKKEYT